MRVQRWPSTWKISTNQFKLFTSQLARKDSKPIRQGSSARSLLSCYFSYPGVLHYSLLAWVGLGWQLDLALEKNLCSKKKLSRKKRESYTISQRAHSQRMPTWESVPIPSIWWTKKSSLLATTITISTASLASLPILLVDSFRWALCSSSTICIFRHKKLKIFLRWVWKTLERNICRRQSLWLSLCILYKLV